MNQVIKYIRWAYSPAPSGKIGDQYLEATVGGPVYNLPFYYKEEQKVVKEITERPAMGDGDKWIWTLHFTDGSIFNIFYPSEIYREPVETNNENNNI